MRINLAKIRQPEIPKRAAINNLESLLKQSRSTEEWWSSLPLEERLRKIHRLVLTIKKYRSAIVETLGRETGRVEFEILSQEITIALRTIRYYLRIAEEVISQRVRKDFLNRIFFPFMEQYSILQPYGVWGMIPAWNGTLQFTFGDAAPALIVGNTLIVKPSEFTPQTTALLQEMTKEADLENELAIIYGAAEEGKWLVEHCDGIHFTGSSAVGLKIRDRCQSRGIPFVGEMGGFDPMIVFPDAQMKRVVNAAVWGRVANSGCNCNAVKILLRVGSESEARTLAYQIDEEMKKLRFGWDYGPMINERQFRTLEGQLQKLLERGAECLSYPKEKLLEKLALATEGNWHFPPIVLFWEDYRKSEYCDSSEVCEETFGPILQVAAVPTEEEAIKIINASPYALGASIWTNDEERVKRLIRELKVGNVTVRHVLANYAIVELPFGGLRLSGNGRRHGRPGIEVFGWWKSVSIAPKRSKTREDYWFPYGRRLGGVKQEQLFRFLIDRVI